MTVLLEITLSREMSRNVLHYIVLLYKFIFTVLRSSKLN
jgi:hypothetical protein